jgi:type I restriction enzyme R subunit
MSQLHHEVKFEEYVTQKLVENGWVEGNPTAYDKERALYPEDVVAWVQGAFPDKWEKLVKLNGSGAERALLDAVVKKLDSKTGGTVEVIRNGVAIPGLATVKMSEAAPEDKNNPSLIERYQKNILRVVRQLKYCPTREWAIDLVFFINGIPVATVELKTDFTQSIDDAIKQYKEDRLPVHPESKRKEPLLTFRRGAVVHFAMSDSSIYMTTKLDGDNTFFLPFNKGNHGHAGNAARDDGEYPVGYFWEEVCTWQNWLRLFHNFVFVEKQNKVDKYGKPYKKETLIFPRYHQMAAVNKMIEDVKQNGAGQQYLNEHSAGSGKTNTIAWTAHDLIKIRTEDGTPYFNSVIIVTDRTVLDAQLQDAVSQIDHQFGVVTNIEKQVGEASKSKQLAKALTSGSPIIVVTIQTFPYAMEAILTEKSLQKRSFAVIVDEAHSSQTGSNAQGLMGALGLKSKPDLEKMTIDDLLEAVQSSRKRPRNVSHFAFTATPKHSTFMLFGRPENPNEPISEDNKPVSFTRYTQRQAIEEGFILDVLKNYTPYKEAYRLSSTLEQDKRVDKKLANRALARWKSLHPTNVSQKVEFIVEHFVKTVLPLLNGEAKAMIVTSGRPQAVKYKMAFDQYIEKHGLKNIKALVAFSGKVKGDMLGEDDPANPLNFDTEKEYTESNMNPDTDGADLRNVFDEERFNVMIVANKFQTGFNQPKLVAMYLDKRLSGVEAVQTLSRLNRTYPGKEDTFVIDFVNEPQSILDAFKQYDEGAEIEDVQNLNVVYEIKSLLDESGIYHYQDIQKFKETRGKHLLAKRKGQKQKDDPMHKKLYAATQRPTDIYNNKLREFNDVIRSWDENYDKAKAKNDAKGMEHAEAQRSELAKEREELNLFKTRLGKFVRVYNYIAQLIELSDPDLENFSAFAKLLSRRLEGIPIEQVDVSGIVMSYFALKENGDISEGESNPLTGITAGGDEPRDREKEFLSEIIERLNTIFGDLSDTQNQQHFANHIVSLTNDNEVVKEQIAKNTKEQAMNGDLPDVVTKAVVTAMSSHTELAGTLLRDPQTMQAFLGLVYDISKHNQIDNIPK